MVPKTGTSRDLFAVTPGNTRLAPRETGRPRENRGGSAGPDGAWRQVFRAPQKMGKDALTMSTTLARWAVGLKCWPVGR